MFKKKKNGFTILELVCVVAIIGIISLFAIPAMDGAKTQVEISSDTASLNSINTCIVMYCVSQNLDSLKGQTSINCFKPIADGASVESIVLFMQDKGLLSDTAKIYFPQGHSYSTESNEVS